MSILTKLKQPFLRHFYKKYDNELKLAQRTYAQYLEETEVEETESRLTIEPEEVCFFFLKGVKGTLARGMKERILETFAGEPHRILLYGDEDQLDKGGELGKPLYRPDWSPDTFLSRYCLGSFVAIRKSALIQARQLQFIGQRETYLEEAALWELCYQVISHGNGFAPQKREAAICHLAEIGYHRESSNEKAEKTYVTKFIKENKTTTVSIIIPSKDHPEILKTCVTSIRKTVRSTEIQIIVIDNGSSLKNREILKRLSVDLNFEYIYQIMEFNFARMCNIAAKKGNGELLLFLNDDIQCITSGWLEAMITVALREHVGAVGAKLYYPNSQKIQHAGITNLPIGPVHKLQFLPDDVSYYDEYNSGVRNVIGVTGACLMVKNSLYKIVGGMCEDLAIAFNDVDLCFQLHELGYYNAVVQDYPLWHHESISRGQDESEEKWLRLMKERETLYKRHPELIGRDPYYNIHLNRRGLDTRILPAYVMGRDIEPRLIQGEPIELPKNAREDECLLLRVETIENILIEGYGVVLGSDNCLFDKRLLLRNNEGRKEVFQFRFTPAYRKDIEENMPDQVRVALSGFSFMIDSASLPAGWYEVGMMAKELTGRTILMNWSTRRVMIHKEKGII